MTIHIIVIDRQGVEHKLEALEGWRLMEIIRDWGLDVKAECGGACACGTCHVYVDPCWNDRLPLPSEEEMAQLDDAPRVEANSRLSCQILMRREFNGLRLRLAPGSQK